MSSSYSRDERPVERTVDRTVVVNDGGRSGGSGWFIAGLLVVALVIGGFFVFGGNLFGSAGGGGSTNVTIDTPDINVGSAAAPAGGASSGSAAPAN
ncbi:hypothetical protein [Aureimonas sp. AU22]|uniref:hypothetical protein n=1 Tax=Aureimonas sp. AU22 TaxID=1638162 RepID=UPI0007845404|nr:hypothetical protein [Aureimonas sp. AU22]